MPERIQRQRTKGWRLPDGAVYVGRPSRFGNRFVIGEFARWPYTATGNPGDRVVIRDRAHAVQLFRNYAHITSGYDIWVRMELAGKDLCCWCPLDQPCHADVLLELANG